jgi:hypothetical protein
MKAVWVCIGVALLLMLGGPWINQWTNGVVGIMSTKAFSLLLLVGAFVAYSKIKSSNAAPAAK